MAVTFKISGLDGNYKSGAAKENIAGLEYADASWDPSHWSGLTGDKYDARITGDGTYTVWMETGGATADGAVVFCIDINNLDNDLVDASKVKAEIVNIALDTDPTVGMDFSKTEFVNKDDKDTDGRIEIYSEYGSTKQNGVDASGLHFAGNMIVNFTIKGIDGNLKAQELQDRAELFRPRLESLLLGRQQFRTHNSHGRRHLLGICYAAR